MNGKKAKMLRRHSETRQVVQKVAKSKKKLYNTLNADERSLLRDIYEFNEKRKSFSEN
tara:strand:+ start:351 stop:524 length:174 start_codon:yes stop_codon:yes gene_type:complete